MSGRTSATIWVETDGPCDVEVLGHRTRHVHGRRPPLRARDHRGSCSPATTDRVRGAPRRRACVWPLGRQLAAAERRSAPSATGRCGCCSARAARPRRTSRRDPRDGARPERPRCRRAPRPRPAHARSAHRTQWPDIAVMLGDQVYADDSSPATHERIKSRARRASDRGLPPSSSTASRSTAGCTTSRGRRTSSAGSSRSCRRR